MVQRRRNYFIDRTFQSEFILKFFVLVIFGCLVFGVVLYLFSGRALTTLFQNSRLVIKSTADFLLPGLFLGGFIVGLLMAIAAGVIVLLMTHRIAGPMFRFARYVEQIGSGELTTDLKIRKKDQFQNLVAAFNKMTDDLNAGILKIVDVSERLGVLIDRLSDPSNKELLLREDIKKLISELRHYKQELTKAISYFKLKR